MADIKLLSERIEIIQRKRIEDRRGWFLKAITGLEKALPPRTGEIYTVYSKDGASRGGHYHKDATEWFTLLVGKSKLELKDINTRESMNIFLDACEPTTIVIPPFVAHRFDAIGENSFLLLAYTNILYDPKDTIPFDF